MSQDKSPSGSPPAHESLLAHAAWLRRLVHALVSDAAQADDVIQETWLASLEHTPRKPGRAWLRSVARNVVRSLHRSGTRRRRRELRAEPPGGLPDPALMAERLELQRYLLAQVQALGEPYRTTLLLRYYEGLEPSEIAGRSGTPAGTVRARLSRGLEMLRARLDDRCRGKRSAWVALLMLPAPGRAAPAAGRIGARAKTALAVVCLLAAGSILWVRAATPRAPDSAAPRAADGRRGAPARHSVGAQEATTRGDAGPNEPAASSSWRLAGTVHDPAGRPVPGARVSVAAYFGAVALDLDETSADRDGRYAADLEKLRAVPPLRRSVARLFVRAVADRHKPGQWIQLGWAHHDRSETVALRRDLILTPGAAVRGRVLLPDGRAASGAEVTVDGLDDTFEYAEAGRDGTYEVALPDAGARRIRARKSGIGAAYAPLQLDATASASIPDLVLRSAGSIEGVVVDPAGHPCRDVEVSADHEGEWPPDGLKQTSTRTDRDGRFVLAGLGTGRYRLYHGAPGVVTYPVGARDVRLVLDGVRLRVSIRDEHGRPFPGVFIRTKTWGPQAARAAADCLEGRTNTLPKPLMSSDVSIWRPEEPTAVLTTLPGSLWMFSGSWVRGAAPFQRIVRVPATGVREIDVDIVIAPQQATGRLDVRLRDECKRPVEGYEASVRLPVSRTAVMGFRAGDDGGPGLSPPLSPGRYLVEVTPGPPRWRDTWAECPGELGFHFGLEATVEIRADETTRLERELRTGGRLRVRVELPDRTEGEEVRHVTARLRSGTGREVHEGVFLVPQGDGFQRRYCCVRNGKTATLEKLLEPGAYEVTLQVRGYHPAQQTVGVKPGEYAEAAFRLTRE